MKALLLFLLPLFLYAKCTYNLDLKFDVNNQQLLANVDVTDSSKSININLDTFNIQNKATVTKALNDGANHLEFSYKLYSKNITPEFIYLLDGWYPRVNELCEFSIKTNLDSNYQTIFEKTNNVIKNATFIASNQYNVTSKNYKHIKISTYFFQKNNTLAQTYLNKTIEYIKLYEKLIAPFPFKTFNIVENHYTTGYSMPTYTLVGSYLLNKPYLLNRSLGHEILHQYFGNSLFYNNEKGNYGEGLVTHLADNYYAKKKGDSLQRRKNDLVQYDTFATEEFPAREFTHRFDKNSMAIGYTKIAYIFQMLEEKLGSESFFTILQKLYEQNKFSVVNLDELQAFFQKETKEDLNTFFNQWFNQEGLIDFKVNNFEQSYHRGVFTVKFTVEQKNPMQFNLPIEVITYDNTQKTSVQVSKEKESFTLKYPTEVMSLSFDKNLTLFRKLFEKEYPLNIGSLLKENKLIIVMDKSYANNYAFISKIFPNGKLIYSDDLKFSDIKNNSILFLDKNNNILQHFLPRLQLKHEDAFLTLKVNTYNPKKLFAVLHSKDKLKRSFFMLKHYGNFKTIVLTNKGVKKLVDHTAFGETFEFGEKPVVSVVKKPQYLDTIVNEIGDVKIVYATESHTNMTHHLNQLRVIKSLVEAGKKVTLAMEMFQKPYQNALDDFIAGKTTTNEFLKASQYYKRWKFNYNYYKPLLDYAKEKKLKVIAINTDREFVKEVNQQGILAIKDKSKLPKKIDQSSTIYKKNLTKIFENHNFKSYHKNEKDEKPYKQDYFFQSQLIWDETMAQNIVNHVNQHPDETIVVIVGSGHVENHYGIPQRVYADTQLPYKVVLNDKVEALENDIILKNDKEISIKESLKLGVYLNTENQLKIIKVKEDSFAKTIGLKKNDIILKFNGEALEALADLKRLLYFKDDYKDIKLTIKRDEEILNFEVPR